MRNIFTIAIMFYALTSFGQKNLNLGQGILNINIENLPTIYFYSDTNDTKPVKKVSVTKSKDGEYTLQNKTEVTAWFKPEGLWPDYSIFVIRVDTVLGKWYRVYTDNIKGTTLWTKADPTNRLVKWQTFLLRHSTAIEKNPDFNLDIKTKPSVNSATIKRIEKTDCFEVLEIKGDWLRIRTNTILDCNESKKTIKSGWIKWRQNNRLTINYGLTC